MFHPPEPVTVIVPTYNERANLAPLAARLFDALSPNACTLLIVDDDSSDGTAAEAESLAKQFPIRCNVRRNERGLATAVIAGLRAADTPIAVVMDADLSHPPESIPIMLEKLQDPAVDMVIGSRFAPGGSIDSDWPLHRRLFTASARLLARPLTNVRDMMAGFFAVRTADLRLEALKPIGYKIALELIVRHHWEHVAEVPIRFAERQHGQTKLNFAEQVRYLRHLCRLYAAVLSSRRVEANAASSAERDAAASGKGSVADREIDS